MKKVSMIGVIAEARKVSEYAADIADYGGSTYICDAISEIAESNMSIYYSDIMDFISRNPEALAEVIDEGLYDPAHNYDLYKHGQAAEYMTIERELYNNLSDILRLYAADYILRQHGEEIPLEVWEAVEERLEDIDSGNDLYAVESICDDVLTDAAEADESGAEITVTAVLPVMAAA